MNIYKALITTEEITNTLTKLDSIVMEHGLISAGLDNAAGPGEFENFLNLRISDYTEGQADVKEDPTDDNKLFVDSALDQMIICAIIYRIIKNRERLVAEGSYKINKHY